MHSKYRKSASVREGIEAVSVLSLPILMDFYHFSYSQTGERPPLCNMAYSHNENLSLSLLQILIKAHRPPAVPDVHPNLLGGKPL